MFFVINYGSRFLPWSQLKGVRFLTLSAFSHALRFCIRCCEEGLVDCYSLEFYPPFRSMHILSTHLSPFPPKRLGDVASGQEGGLKIIPVRSGGMREWGGRERERERVRERERDEQNDSDGRLDMQTG